MLLIISEENLIETSPALDENIEGFLRYSFTWLTRRLIFLFETKNKSVRFHALQSVFAFLELSVILDPLQARRPTVSLNIFLLI